MELTSIAELTKGTFESVQYCTNLSYLQDILIILGHNVAFRRFY